MSTGCAVRAEKFAAIMPRALVRSRAVVKSEIRR